MPKITYFTSESVTEGHPDKLCDQIADAILDEMIKDDPLSRSACEVTATTGIVNIMGEISTDAYVSFPDVARGVVSAIGYNGSDCGFDATTCAVVSSVHEQSPDIAMGVDQSMEAKTQGGKEEDNGAGDQGMVFGFACDETPELMPMPIMLAHGLCRRLAQVRKEGQLSYLRPDGKAQVTVEYHDGVPARVDAVVVSTQHSPEVSMEALRRDLLEHVIKAAIPAELLDSKTKYYINPTGRFVIGGPAGDSGLTGRKIIVDTYGGYSRHGGGAFSGKDPTKVDRSGAYMARYVAKNIVAAGLAKKCELQISYAIGVARPVSIAVETFGTETVPVEAIEKAVATCFDLRPTAIINQLDLRRPIFRKTAAYGHFGRQDADFTWEKCDKVEALQKACGK